MPRVLHHLASLPSCLHLVSMAYHTAQLEAFALMWLERHLHQEAVECKEHTFELNVLSLCWHAMIV